MKENEAIRKLFDIMHSTNFKEITFDIDNKKISIVTDHTVREFYEDEFMKNYYKLNN